MLHLLCISMFFLLCLLLAAVLVLLRQTWCMHVRVTAADAFDCPWSMLLMRSEEGQGSVLVSMLVLPLPLLLRTSSPLLPPEPFPPVSQVIILTLVLTSQNRTY